MVTFILIERTAFFATHCFVSWLPLLFYEGRRVRSPPLFFFVSALLPIVNYCVLLRSVTRLFDLNSLAGSRADVHPPLPLRFFSWFNRPRFLSHYDLFFRREVGVGAGSLASVLVFFLPTILSPPPLPPSICQAW
ncbi:hypothetical protein C8J57DRAFT_1299852 [Mycena rebaudengoi]|nr:hypothetical protein C8J57DRAFT_1299852 [Mycena rebaudengoi]